MNRSCRSPHDRRWHFGLPSGGQLGRGQSPVREARSASDGRAGGNRGWSRGGGLRWRPVFPALALGASFGRSDRTRSVSREGSPERERRESGWRAETDTQWRVEVATRIPRACAWGLPSGGQIGPGQYPVREARSASDGCAGGRWRRSRGGGLRWRPVFPALALGASFGRSDRTRTVSRKGSPERERRESGWRAETVTQWRVEVAARIPRACAWGFLREVRSDAVSIP
jgi:hypothetical protein